MNINLNASENLLKLGLINSVNTILNQSYENNEEVEDRTNYLYNTYNTFYNFCKIVTHSYSVDELIIIANTIYLLRENTTSLKKLFYYFDIDGLITYLPTSKEVIIRINKVDTTDNLLFITILEKLVQELLITKGSTLVITNIRINLSYEVNNNFNIITRLINNSY